MKYEKVYITKEIDDTLLRSFLDHVINMLEKFKIKRVNISFRYAWGNLIHNWEYFEIESNNIKPEIDKAEKKELGILGDDDLFIHIEKYAAELQFCHHSDLHLSFPDENDFVKGILGFWEEHDIPYST